VESTQMFHGQSSLPPHIINNWQEILWSWISKKIYDIWWMSWCQKWFRTTPAHWWV
jgi:hypothetical protein